MGWDFELVGWDGRLAMGWDETISSHGNPVGYASHCKVVHTYLISFQMLISQIRLFCFIPKHIVHPRAIKSIRNGAHGLGSRPLRLYIPSQFVQMNQSTGELRTCACDRSICHMILLPRPTFYATRQMCYVPVFSFLNPNCAKSSPYNANRVRFVMPSIFSLFLTEERTFYDGRNS